MMNFSGKIRRLLGLVVFCILCVACAESVPTGPVQVEDAPRLEGKWLVLNYWAVWCAPCREEIPELNAFARARAEDVIVYGVNYDGAQGGELRAQAAELGIGFPLLRGDPAAVLGYAAPTALPTTIIIAPGGEAHARLLGPQTKSSLARALAATDYSLGRSL